MLFEENEKEKIDWDFLVLDAMPIDEDDYGSLRQVKAEYELYEAIKKHISEDLALSWSEAAEENRMTSEESAQWIHCQLIKKGYIVK